LGEALKFLPAFWEAVRDRRRAHAIAIGLVSEPTVISEQAGHEKAELLIKTNGAAA
jgi:hypothetical protein